MKRAIVILALACIATHAQAGAYERMQSDRAERESYDRIERSNSDRYERRAERVQRKMERQRRNNTDYLCENRPRGCADRWTYRD